MADEVVCLSADCCRQIRPDAAGMPRGDRVLFDAYGAFACPAGGP